MIADYVVDLSKYNIIEKIDENQYQNRFLIEDQKTRTQYIAKVYKNESITPNQQKSFLIEVQTYLQQQYPTLIHAIGYNFFNFESKPCPTIIFEYLPKGSLRNLLEKIGKNEIPPFWTDTIRYCIILGIAFGLRYLHSKNIILKNLTPECILLDNYCIPRIHYSPISQITEEQLQHHLNDYNSFYTAPEIISNKKFDSKVDTFSFAKIAYEIITLKHSPINIMDIADTENQKFFEKCLSKEPTQRLSSKSLLTHITDKKFLDLFKNIDFAVLKKFLDMFINENDFLTRLEFLFNPKLESNTNVNKEIELSYLRKFADKGNADAMYFIYLLSGDKTENEEEAFHYLKMAVDKEQTKALFIYAKKLRDGDKFVEKNIEDALFYFKLAANKGHRDAMVEYAGLRREGKNEAPIDKKEAARYFKLAADNMSKIGMEEYADMLRKGDGIPVNIAEADHYSKMAQNASNDCMIC